MSNLDYIVIFAGDTISPCRIIFAGLIMKAPVIYYIALVVFCILTLSVGTVNHLI